MNYLIDYHMHTFYSFDAKQTIEDAALKALENNISEICFTEHISFDPEDQSYNYFNFKEYKNNIDEIQEKYKDKLSIKTGLEVGEFHLYKDDFKNYYKQNNLDFIIGSIHNINKKGLRTNLRENGDISTYKSYFNEVLELSIDGDFDVVGHLDLVQRYAYDEFNVYDFSIYKDQIYDILKILISRGKGLEINTSGLSKNLLFPRLDILKMYHDLGGEIITVGSDAHTSSRVGENISYAYDLLKSLNYKYIYTFKNRNPSGILL